MSIVQQFGYHTRHYKHQYVIYFSLECPQCVDTIQSAGISTPTTSSRYWIFRRDTDHNQNEVIAVLFMGQHKHINLTVYEITTITPHTIQHYKIDSVILNKLGHVYTNAEIPKLQVDITLYDHSVCCVVATVDELLDMTLHETTMFEYAIPEFLLMVGEPTSDWYVVVVPRHDHVHPFIHLQKTYPQRVFIIGPDRPICVKLKNNNIVYLDMDTQTPKQIHQ